ncbi:hypothetical protein BZA77DRAFT_311253, partial [Pyronema omphalodes]
MSQIAPGSQHLRMGLTTNPAPSGLRKSLCHSLIIGVPQILIPLLRLIELIRRIIRSSLPVNRPPLLVPHGRVICAAGPVGNEAVKFGFGFEIWEILASHVGVVEIETETEWRIGLFVAAVGARVGVEDAEDGIGVGKGILGTGLGLRTGLVL